MAEQTWPRDALPAETVVGGYRIVGLLGRGGFGITYRAVDRIDQHFALKECFPRPCVLRHGADVVAAGAEDADLYADCLARFLREARALARLSGTPGVVRALTVFEANATAYLVMELIPGESLDSRLRRGGALDPPTLERMMRGLLDALAAVHRAGFLHRDVKPANVQMAPNGTPVLIDFGATRAISPGQTTRFTQILSEGYAPIEQYIGARQGPPADLYAFGMTCYRAIGGKPVDAFTRQQAVMARMPDPLMPAVECGAGRYRAEVLAAIDRAVAIEAANRPADAASLLLLLDAAPPPAEMVHGAGTEASPPAPAPGGIPTDPPGDSQKETVAGPVAAPPGEPPPAPSREEEALAASPPASVGATGPAPREEAPPPVSAPDPASEAPTAVQAAILPPLMAAADAPAPTRPPRPGRRKLLKLSAAAAALAGGIGVVTYGVRRATGRRFFLDLDPAIYRKQRLNRLSLIVRSMLPLAAPRIPDVLARLVPTIDRAGGYVYLDTSGDPGTDERAFAAILDRVEALLRQFGHRFVTRAAGHDGTGFAPSGADPGAAYDRAMNAAGQIVVHRLQSLGAADASVARPRLGRLAIGYRGNFDAAWAAGRVGLAGEPGFGIGFTGSGFARASRPQLASVAVSQLPDQAAPAASQAPILSYLLPPELSAIGLDPPGVAGARLRVGLAAHARDAGAVLANQQLPGTVAPPDSIGMLCFTDRYTGPAAGPGAFVMAGGTGDVVDPVVALFPLDPIGGRSLATDLVFDLARLPDAAFLRAALESGPLPAAFAPIAEAS